ncbi:uncharacterized protein NPIL_167951 [Nephila pilipes]|uniref:Uncharacterized protein n=1 Tax=Nephila pilipes TaxID=299642 RepID=A0A8X6PUD4_NEPPI|nr:uncharacterized protein NPIL_167951 [Nephila pilipes]
MTRLENTAEDLKLKNVIFTRLQRLGLIKFEKSYSEFSGVDSEIEKFEEKYFFLKLKLQSKPEAFNVLSMLKHRILQLHEVYNLFRIFGYRNLIYQYLMTRLRMGRTFKDLFVSTVYSQISFNFLSQKFQYLKGLLSDEPAFLMKHIPLLMTLTMKHGEINGQVDKKKQITHALIKTFLDQKSISQANLTNLRNIVDTSDERFKSSRK